jgi:hypothetical protein
MPEEIEIFFNPDSFFNDKLGGYVSDPNVSCTFCRRGSLARASMTAVGIDEFEFIAFITHLCISA